MLEFSSTVLPAPSPYRKLSSTIMQNFISDTKMLQVLAYILINI